MEHLGRRGSEKTRPAQGIDATTKILKVGEAVAVEAVVHLQVIGAMMDIGMMIKCECGWSYGPDDDDDDESECWYQWINHDVEMYNLKDQRRHAGWIEE